MKNKLALFFAVLLITASIGGISVQAKSLTFKPHDDIMYPCIDEVKAYLLAGAEADVTRYKYNNVPLQAQVVSVLWEANGLDITGYQLSIATKKDFSDARTVTLNKYTTSYSFKNLLRDTKYYVRLKSAGKDVLTATTEFTTAYNCPRFLDVGGLYNNCRDLGGYRVGDKRIRQNMIIRGSAPDNGHPPFASTFTGDGLTFLIYDIGIKTQLDLRGSAESGGRTTSAFSENGNYVHVPLTAYAPCFNTDQAELYRQAFEVFGNKDNYPIYFHCAGGADRTGTVAAILLAYLGVDKNEIIQDYVVTTFSPVCYSQEPRIPKTIAPVLDGLNKYTGKTLSEKAGSYLLSIGLTPEELANIKNIMLEPIPEEEVEHIGNMAANRLKPITAQDFERFIKKSKQI